MYSSSLIKSGVRNTPNANDTYHEDIISRSGVEKAKQRNDRIIIHWSKINNTTRTG